MKLETLRLSDLFKLLAAFLHRFHTILFFLVVSGGLFVAIMTLISIVNMSSDSASTSDNAVNGSFDEDTIKRVQQDATTTPQPGSRASPFVE